GARLMIADGRLIDRLAVIDSGALEAVLVLGDERPALPGLELISRAGLDGASAATNIAASTAAGTPVSTGARTAVSTAARTVVSKGARTYVSTAASTAASTARPQHDIAPWDTHMVIYTSGTTGPSKGVLSSYIHSYTAALGFRNIGPGDRTLMQLPMFHVGGPYTLLWALIHGGSTVVVDAFSGSRFWDIVRRYEITTVGLLGAMTQFLMKQPESPQDQDHPLR